MSDEHYHVMYRSESRKTFWLWLDPGGLPRAWYNRDAATRWRDRNHPDGLVIECRARHCHPDVPRPRIIR